MKDKFNLLYYALKHKRYLPLSIFKPMLLYLILALVYLIMLSCLSDTLLCDGDSLEELKNQLTSYIKEYYEYNQEYEHYRNLLEQAENRPEKDNGIERYLSIKKNSKAIDIACSLAKVRVLETSIKNKDSSFKSSIIKQWFE